ncbi:TonB-dependent receptor [Dysgonomonas sp. 511]|uniref:TonB-dependent receptor n=1 Tax=Dysgonomonas sp. 511 TaxID=2302930 RepID=UPI0013CF66A5|nr:TonB-dependent receptor plug domain-containing protein [Dysgonomonas sp. 511]
MYKRFILLPIFIILPLFASLQAQNDNITDSIVYNFRRQLAIFPQEKVYAQIDKSFYITGEDIWFRAYLVDAYSHLPDTLSRYIYAELINPIDSVVNRVKIKPHRGAYHGHITLDEELPEGQYQLRFYTRLMESLGEEHFFKRTITIGGPLTALYRIEPVFEYENEKRVNVELSITDLQSGNRIKPEEMRMIADKGFTENLRMGKDSVARLTLKAPRKGRQKSLYIEYDYAGKFHKEFIPVPHRRDYEVSFLPEGGHNIVGIANRVAFKAINSEGRGEDIEGVVVTTGGDTLTAFRSGYLGMGYLMSFSNETDSVLYAVCRNKAGMEKRYVLPSPSASQVALQVNQHKGNFVVSVRTPYGKPLDGVPLYLAAHCRGNVLFVNKWDGKESFAIVPMERLPTGVIQFLLVDAAMNPLSERMVFNANDAEMATIGFEADKDNYGNRKLVKASLLLTQGGKEKVAAGLSIAVTDDKDIKPDSCTSILSSLLLASELKGYIESPASYFDGNVVAKPIDLDALMMTQGWSRYNVSKFLKGDFDKITGYLERGQAISGTIKGGFFMNKKSAGYPVTLISIRNGIFTQTLTDDDGKFVFQGFEAPDSTGFIIQGNTKKGGSRVELLLDYEKYPSHLTSLPFTYAGDKSQFESYMGKADQNFTMLNGMRMIYLKEIEIKAERIEKSASMYSSAMNPRMTSEEFDKYHPRDIFQVLSRFAGVRVMNEEVFIRGNSNPPLVLVDDVEYEVSMLSDLIMQDVAAIEIVKGAGAAIFGVRGGGGAILITTKKGEMPFRNPEKFNIKRYTPLGYQTAKEFYSPQYETREQLADPNPDLRTTIYWNPDLRAGDDGNAAFSFYTADGSTTYSVVIEGVTSNGMPVRTVRKISRTDK